MSSFEKHIEAFKIFQKYDEKKDGWPLHAEHDTIYCSINPDKVSDEDKKDLEGLGWHSSSEDEHFYHFT
jgi:hypothetical protein